VVDFAAMSLPPPPPPWSGPIAAGVDPPGRGVVFIQVLLRAFALAVVGGAVIGLGLVAVAWGFDSSFGEIEDSDGWLVGLLIGPLFGAVFGTLLGIPAAIILACIAAFGLVPYRGRKRTRLVIRIAAALCVAAFFAVLSGGDDRIWYVVGAAGVLGAILLSPWLVNWYIRRAEPSPGV
jgi:hypothetical protein